MTKLCRRPGCPGVVTHGQASLGFNNCTAVCSQIESIRAKTMTRLEAGELNGRHAEIASTLAEVDALDALEASFDAYLTLHVRNVPGLQRAAREARGSAVSLS